MGKVTGILVNVENGEARVKEIDNTLEGYYAVLNCSTIDIMYVKMDGKIYTVYCDDEGLLKNDRIPSAIDENYKVMLVGNLFVAKSVEDEEDGMVTVSLDTSDIVGIMLSHIFTFVDVKRNKKVQILKCERA